MSRDVVNGMEIVPEPLPVDRSDGSAELGMRETFQILFYDPAVRNFTFTGLGALGMIFLILLEQASDIGGFLIVILGACGILFRWTASPVLVLVILTYFMVFPFGIPWDVHEYRLEISEGHFRIGHIMLVLSVLVYLSCQYRLYGLVSQAIPFEGPVPRRGETPTRRPPALIRPTEFGILLGACAAFVFLGQMIWWLVNAIEVVPTADFPLRWAVSDPLRSDGLLPGGMTTGTTRFVLLVGLLFFGTLVARLVFGYWRLRMMGPAEGGMVLLDGGWSETSRERQRQEVWRIWGRKRARAGLEGTGQSTGEGKS